MKGTKNGQEKASGNTQVSAVPRRTGGVSLAPTCPQSSPTDPPVTPAARGCPRAARSLLAHQDAALGHEPGVRGAGRALGMGGVGDITGSPRGGEPRGQHSSWERRGVSGRNGQAGHGEEPKPPPRAALLSLYPDRAALCPQGVPKTQPGSNKLAASRETTTSLLVWWLWCP